MDDKLTVDEMVHLLKKFSHSELMLITTRADIDLQNRWYFRTMLGHDEQSDPMAETILKQTERYEMFRDPQGNLAAIVRAAGTNLVFTAWLWRYIINLYISGEPVPNHHVDLAKCLRSGLLSPKGVGELLRQHPEPEAWEVGPYLDVYHQLKRPEGLEFANEAELLAFEPGPGELGGPLPLSAEADLARGARPRAPGVTGNDEG